MNSYSIYSLTTGIFTGFVVHCDAELLDVNVPEGHSALLGEFNHLTQCVQLSDHTVIDYVPPAPANDDTQTWSWDTTAKRWVSTPTAAAQAANARERRTQLLAACDWTQSGDSPLSDDAKAAWRTYRAALRGVPEQAAFPGSISWPTAPT